MRLLYKLPPSTEEALLTAHMALLAGRYGITTYVMVDGQEQRSETGFGPLKRGMEALGQAAIKVVAEFRGFAEALKANEEFARLAESRLLPLKDQPMMSYDSGEWKNIGGKSW